MRRHVVWSLAGNAVYRGCQWGMLIILAKLSTAEMTGRFAFAFAFTAPVFMLSNLQSRAILATDAADQFPFGDYLTLRIATTLVAGGLIAGLVGYGGYARPTALVIFAVTLAKAFESVSDIYQGAMQQQDRMDRIAISLMVKGGLSLGALWAAVSLTGSVLIGTLCLAASWGVVLSLYDAPVTQSIRRRPTFGPAPSLSRLSHLAALSLPLGVVMMLMSLKVSIPRVFVEHHLGEAQLGFYAVMAYATVAGEMVVNSLGQCAAPRLARHYVAGDFVAFRHVVIRLVAIGACLGIISVSVAAVAGREILAALYRPEYASHANVFLILVAASAVGYIGSLLGYTLTASRFLKVQMPIAGAIAGISALGCVFLVPRQGLRGAALAELVAAIAQSAVLLWFARQACQELKRAARS